MARDDPRGPIAWADTPSGTALADCLAIASGRPPGAALQALDWLFADTGWIQDFVRFHGRAMLADPKRPLPYRSFNNDVLHSLMVASCGPVDLSLAVIDGRAWQVAHRLRPQAAVISFATGWIRIRFLVAGGARIRHYSVSPDNRLRSDRLQLLCDGDSLHHDQSHDAFDIEHINTDIVMLRAMVRDPDAPVAREFDAVTGDQILASATQGLDTRLETLCALVRAMDRTDALPMLLDITHSGTPHLRWQAMREALALDCAAALPRLRLMADHDPADEVRSTARRTMAYLVQSYPQLTETQLCPA